ncbi:hypothetical protein Q3G72_032243 [Acer saccharum]|nr:hypothetical protein Q3G72_032243 [Acer saccharum]
MFMWDLQCSWALPSLSLELCFHSLEDLLLPQQHTFYPASCGYVSTNQGSSAYLGGLTGFALYLAYV